MSRSAAVIAALKSPGAPSDGISRPYAALLEQALGELGIHLQVEDIKGGLLLFWRERGDFNQTARILTATGTDIKASTWDKGEMLWRLTLLKPPEFTEVQGILAACRDIVLALFGPRCTPEVTGPALSFRSPAEVNLLKAFWRRYSALKNSEK
jgi:hypothetical protein